jgi:hypothetical protein
MVAHARGTGMLAPERGCDSVPQNADIAVSCTRLGVPAALQRRYDPGRIPWIDLLFFRLGTGHCFLSYKEYQISVKTNAE